MFLRGSSASSGQDLRRPGHKRRPSGLRRSASISPAATITLSTDRVPGSEDAIISLVNSAWAEVPRKAPVLDETGFDDDTDIKNLDLRASGFDRIPISLFLEADCFLHIETLDLSENPLCSSQDLYMTDTIILPHLKSLILRQCGMSRVDPLVKHLKAPNLRELDISSHELTGFVPEFQQHFPNLRHLNASRGQFEFVEE